MNREVMTSLAWGLGIVVLALCATFARSRGYIDSAMVDRLVMGAVGLMVAWFGNQMPKRFVPSTRARQAQRVAGWSMALSGLVYAGFCGGAGQHRGHCVLLPVIAEQSACLACVTTAMR